MSASAWFCIARALPLSCHQEGIEHLPSHRTANGGNKPDETCHNVVAGCPGGCGACYHRFCNVAHVTSAALEYLALLAA